MPRRFSPRICFAVPFTTFDSEDFQPDNPLTKSALKLESGGLTPIHGAYIPGQAWADGVANALLEYAQGTGDWNGVKKAYLDDWTSAWNDYENNFGMLPRPTSDSPMGCGESHNAIFTWSITA